MTNRTKWIVALPFAFTIAFAVPAAVAGEWMWFRGDWAASLFVFLTALMWLAATAFVDVGRPRGPRDVADNLIALGFLAAVPRSVYDRIYGFAATMPSIVSIVGLILSTTAVVIGLSARRAIGSAYIPRDSVLSGNQLIRSGPYRWVRHPLYTAALLWAIGWPLIIGSFTGAVVALGFLLPALRRRMGREEDNLMHTYGDEYRTYCSETWRLLPFIY
jgi:protein-S-isoprenylcysteine O-methyltransferase Ste14